MTQSDSVVYVPRHVVRQTHPAARDKLIPRLAGLALAALLCVPAPAAQAQQQEGTVSGVNLATSAAYAFRFVEFWDHDVIDDESLAILSTANS